MTKEEKVKIVTSLSEEFKSSQAIVVCDFKGLNVKSLEALRASANEAGVKVQVIKNTLASIALNNADLAGMSLKDTNIFVWGDDQISVTKVAAKFAEKAELFVIKSAFLEGQIADAQTVNALSKMPSRDELIGMLLQVWNAPIQNFTIGLDALRAKKEESA
ncbi:MAG: 50S ribosomal protein L10 [Sulfurospirillum sp.]|nr:50S ribosomal protein L10 [Sulfurospirillum sp.]